MTAVTQLSSSLDAVEPPPAHAFPPLHLIHLLAWTAATALAFGLHRFQIKALARLVPDFDAPEPSMLAAALGATYGVAQGCCLFVAGAVIVWRSRGCAARLAPAHYLSFEVAARWAGQGLAGIRWAWDSGDGLYRSALVLSGLLVTVVFLVWFISLALRREESIWWRLVLAIVALAPASSWLLLRSQAFTGARGIQAHLLTQMTGTLALCLALAVAMTGDVRAGRVRHWSHWVSAGGFLVLACVRIFSFIWQY